jgi:hypothetical protein
VTGWGTPGCLVGSALSVGALLGDPIGAPEQLADRARAELVELETLGRVAITLDSGPAILRPVLGLRPAGDAVGEILGDGAASIDRALASMTPMRQALLAARPPARPAPGRVTDVVAARIVEALRGPDPSVPPEAATAATRLEEIPRAVARARLRLILLVLRVGGLRWLEGLAVGLAIRAFMGRAAPPLRPPAPRALDRPEPEATGSQRSPRAPTPADPIETALVSEGVPIPLACEIAGRFAMAPDWPGSLRGHDREPGGLRRHTRRVLEAMREETAGWPAEPRAAAALVAAAHDLGKLVAYRRVGPDRWIGVAATPHDALSAILLARCPAWPAFVSAATRAAVLQCLHADHAPEGLPANAPPLARELLVALKRADAAAARDAPPVPDGGAGGPADAA